MSRNNAHLLDALHAAEKIVVFCQGMDKAAFLKDDKTQAAVLHQLMVLGEAVKRISDDFRTHHAEIPWKDIAGMRDRLIHGYDQVNLKRVWKTITGDVPLLIPSFKKFLPTK
jgi:uncharacterized protein with HEPN domain